ncbi:MAG: lactate racemase domain-containing protein [Chloroflexota bacterium]
MELPRMVKIRQVFPTDQIDDVESAIAEQMATVGLARRIKPGARVAITAGSRGIAHIARIIRAVAAELKGVGARPFVVPAMGSHGGATAEGQIEILTSYGITEEYVGAPVVSSMDTVILGTTPSGAVVHMDKNAYSADATVVIARVKAHTAFKAPIESGLCKMIAVGLGKHVGAQEMHRHNLGESVPQAATLAIDKANIALGLGIAENAYDQPYRIVAVPPDRFLEADAELLRLSNSLLPRVPFDRLDLLIIDWMGKNFSGSGMDMNIIGMWRRIGGERIPDFRRIAVLALTPDSHGNATGIGAADFTTRRLVDAIDLKKTYMNCLTAGAPELAKLPMTLESDREAIETALRTILLTAPPRIARIRNTLHLEELLISENLLPEAQAMPHVQVVGEPEPLDFDETGNLRLE